MILIGSRCGEVWSKIGGVLEVCWGCDCGKTKRQGSCLRSVKETKTADGV